MKLYVISKIALNKELNSTIGLELNFDSIFGNEAIEILSKINTKIDKESTFNSNILLNSKIDLERI